jgi:hypothetical protein
MDFHAAQTMRTLRNRFLGCATDLQAAQTMRKLRNGFSG